MLDFILDLIFLRHLRESMEGCGCLTFIFIFILIGIIIILVAALGGSDESSAASEAAYILSLLTE